MIHLLRACRRGDEDAARRLVALTSPALLAGAAAILRDQALAEDAVQQAFGRFLALPARKVGAVRDPLAWLMMLTRREALMTLRASRRRAARVAGYAASFPPRRPEPLHGVEAPRGRIAALNAAIEGLPRRLHEIIVLRHVAGLTFDQMAIALSANRSTIASRYRRALEHLRTTLAEPEPDRPRLPGWKERV